MKATGQGVQVFPLNQQTDRRTDGQLSCATELHVCTRFTCSKALKTRFCKPTTRITARLACVDLLAELIASVFSCDRYQYRTRRVYIEVDN